MVSNNNHKTKPLHVAIMEFDAMPGSLKKDYGSFASMFMVRMHNAMKRAQTYPEIRFSTWSVPKDEFPDPEHIDAMMITGSPASIIDPPAWLIKFGEFVADTYRRYPHIKLVGICLGHQTIAENLLKDYGVTVKRDPRGLQSGSKTINLNPNFRSHFSDVQKSPQIPNIQVYNTDYVYIPPEGLPAGWMTLGITNDYEMHGLFQPGRVLTFQGHFEIDSVFYTKLKNVINAKREPGDEDVTTTTAGATTGIDGGEFAADIILSFLTDAPADQNSSRASHL